MRPRVDRLGIEQGKIYPMRKFLIVLTILVVGLFLRKGVYAASNLEQTSLETVDEATDAAEPVVTVEPEKPKEPWEMSKEEYEAPEILYRGAVSPTKTIEEAQPFIDKKTADGTYPEDATWAYETIDGKRRLIARGKKEKGSHAQLF